MFKHNFNKKIFYEILKKHSSILYNNTKLEIKNNEIIFYFPNNYCEELFKKEKEIIFNEYNKTKNKINIKNFIIKYTTDKKKFQEKNKKFYPNIINYTNNLNTNYNFNNYIVGKSNEHAYGISQSIISNKIKNCIFYILGNPSTGKTHLISAIANFFTDKINTAYFTSDDFISHALGDKMSINDFKEYINNFNLICIDDIQNIQKLKKELINNIIFTLLDNTLIKQKKYLIITSDIPAEQLDFHTRIIERLKSSFYSIIEYPDYFMKKEYIENLIKNENIKLKKEQINIIINNCKTFRQINLICNNIIFYVKDIKKDINSAFDETINKFFPNSENKNNNEDLFQKIANYLNISKDFYKKKYISKNSPEFLGIALLCYILKEKNKTKIKDISNLLNRERTTIFKILKETKKIKNFNKHLNNIL